MMDIKVIPLKLAHKPTPVTVIEDLLPGTRIHIKRDDLTGLLYSGNKIRKLEFLLADAQAREADLVITCGPLQSNHVRATVAACKELKLKVLAVLRGKPEDVPDGNFLLDTLLGADFRFITSEEYRQVDNLMEEIAREYEKKGFRPYVIPEGGSNGIGALGYVQVVEEIASYVRENRVDAIFCAVGSGGTYAGLLAGKHIFGQETPLIGILVADDIPTFQKKVAKILSEMAAVLDRKLSITLDQYTFDDRFIGPGYALLYPEVVNTIKEVARFGIILDPVYTAKTFYGMLCRFKERPSKNPLFVHTGGIFSLFPYRSELLSG